MTPRKRGRPPTKICNTHLKRGYMRKTASKPMPLATFKKPTYIKVKRQDPPHEAQGLGVNFNGSASLLTSAYLLHVCLALHYIVCHALIRIITIVNFLAISVVLICRRRVSASSDQKMDKGVDVNIWRS